MSLFLSPCPDELDALLKVEDTHKRLDKFLSSLNADCQLIGASSALAGDALSKFSQYTSKTVQRIELIQTEIYFNNLLQFRVNLPADEETRARTLIKLVLSNKIAKCLIFVNDVSTSQTVYEMLLQNRLDVYRYASDMSFQLRQRSLALFMDMCPRKLKEVLIVEDQLLTGQRLDRISMVINYDLKFADLNMYLDRVVHLLNSKKPRFVVNLVDESASHMVNRLESHFGFKLIELNV